MKTSFLLIVGFLLVFASNNANSQDLNSKDKDLQARSLSIACTPDMFELTSKLASEYSNLNPELKIEVINSSFESKKLNEGENLRFISNRSSSVLNDAGNWKLAVGRKVIVPVINSGNKYFHQLQKRGVTQEQFTQLLKNYEAASWGNLLKNNSTEKIRVYVVNDESVRAGLEKFIMGNPLHYEEVTLCTREEVISAIQRDPNAIGFCNVIDLQNTENQNLPADISLLPIDKNGNGTLDYMEAIYTDLNTFNRGVWIGKYPKTLVNNIFVVSNAQPASETELDFLKWVLTDGQKYLNASGFSELAKSESRSQIDKMNFEAVHLADDSSVFSLSKILVGILTIIVIGIVTGSVIRRRRRVLSVPDISTDEVTGFDFSSIALPNGLYFDKTHTWAFMEKDGLVSIGIDDFIQHVTGTITRVEMKNMDEKVKKGELLFSIIQSGKQLNMYAPVSGMIKKHNESLRKNPAALNQSPYSDGWVYQIKPANWFMEIQQLDVSEKYRTWLNAEFLRLKDFVAVILKPESPEYAHVVLQDGGEMKEGVLSGFGPDVWEDFQTNFIDTFK